MCLAVDFAYQNVLWIETRGQWACCGDNILHCSSAPTNAEYFNAIPSTSWSAIPSPTTPSTSRTSSITTTTASSSSASASATAASTAALPSSTSPPGQDGLSTGAKAGIGIGCAIAGLAVIAVIAVFLLRRRRRSFSPGDAGELATSNPQKPPAEMWQTPTELAGSGLSAELPYEQEHKGSIGHPNEAFSRTRGDSVVHEVDGREV